MTEAVIIKKPETICSATQWPGFCMITVSVMKELMIYFFAFQKALLWKAHFSYRSSAVFSLTRLISWIVNRLHRGSFKKYIRSNLVFFDLLPPLYAFVRFEKTPSSFVHFMYIFTHPLSPPKEQLRHFERKFTEKLIFQKGKKHCWHVWNNNKIDYLN